MRYCLRASALASVTALAAAVLLLHDASPTQVAAAEPPAQVGAELAMVPADAVGFIHVRLADLWKNDVMEGFRKTWEKAGPKALEALDKQFVPAPSTITRGTAFVLIDEHKQPRPVFILTFSKSFDPKAVATTHLPNMTIEKANGKTVYRSPSVDGELYFPDDKTIVIGVQKSLDYYLAKAPAKDGPLASSIKLAASGTKVLVASADISSLPIPPEAFRNAPADVLPIMKAKQLTLAVDLGADARFDIHATYVDGDTAQDAEKAIKSLADLGRKELAKKKKELEDKLHDPDNKGPRPADELPEALAQVFAIGAVARLDETLADPKLITRDKAELAVAVPLPKEVLVVAGGLVAVGVGALIPTGGLDKFTEGLGRTASSNNLKQIMLAIHNYHDANGQLPADIVDKNGKPLLSWRVAILPYIEQDALYKQFKMDEAWDGKNNAEWSKTVVRTFLSPDAKLPKDPEWGMTNYHGITGPGTVFEAGKKITFTDITDGTSNTVAVIETDDLVPWAKPGGFAFDPKKPLPKITPVRNRKVFLAGMCDGSVRSVSTSVEEKTLKAAFTRSGGEVFTFDK